MSAQSNIA